MNPLFCGDMWLSCNSTVDSVWIGYDDARAHASLKQSVSYYWKNNLLLESDEFSNLNYRDNVVNYISDNYITQFKRTYSDGSFFGYNITYDFDTNSRLTKETRDYFGDPEYNHNPKKVEVLYEYE